VWKNYYDFSKYDTLLYQPLKMVCKRNCTSLSRLLQDDWAVSYWPGLRYLPKALWGAIADGDYATDTVLLMESPRYSPMALKGWIEVHLAVEDGLLIKPRSKVVKGSRQ
jgi:hypothetical protein